MNEINNIWISNWVKNTPQKNANNNLFDNTNYQVCKINNLDFILIETWANANCYAYLVIFVLNSMSTLIRWFS